MLPHNDFNTFSMTFPLFINPNSRQTNMPFIVCSPYKIYKILGISNDKADIFSYIGILTY